MDLLDLNAVSTLSGVAAVLLVMFIRLHWPFRFQYMGSLFMRKPDRVMRWLETSYRKNRSRTVAMLDKSTREIMAGNYDLAEAFVAEGLSICKDSPSLFNQAMVHYLFYNLAMIYFYRGKYEEAIQIAFQVYQRDRSLMNALGVIVCAHARLGDLQAALEAYQLLPKRKLREELRLFCMAEIEAARGEYDRAIRYMKRLSMLRYTLTLYLNPAQIEKRLEEWTKASSRAG